MPSFNYTHSIEHSSWLYQKLYENLQMLRTVSWFFFCFVLFWIFLVVVVEEMFRHHCTQGKDMVNCRITFPEACLCLSQNVVFCPLSQTWVNDWSVKFTNAAQERNATVLVRIGCVAFLVNWLNNSFCTLWGVWTLFKDFIEEVYQVVNNIVSSDLQKNQQLYLS